jgi:hypothetical protein
MKVKWIEKDIGNYPEAEDHYDFTKVAQGLFERWLNINNDNIPGYNPSKDFEGELETFVQELKSELLDTSNGVFTTDDGKEIVWDNEDEEKEDVCSCCGGSGTKIMSSDNMDLCPCPRCNGTGKEEG